MKIRKIHDNPCQDPGSNAFSYPFIHLKSRYSSLHFLSLHRPRLTRTYHVRVPESRRARTTSFSLPPGLLFHVLSRIPHLEIHSGGSGSGTFVVLAGPTIFRAPRLSSCLRVGGRGAVVAFARWVPVPCSPHLLLEACVVHTSSMATLDVAIVGDFIPIDLVIELSIATGLDMKMNYRGDSHP
jgi:hypothetical protein